MDTYTLPNRIRTSSRLVICGGGASAILLLRALAESAHHGIHVTVIEPSGSTASDSLQTYVASLQRSATVRVTRINSVADSVIPRDGEWEVVPAHGDAVRADVVVVATADNEFELQTHPFAGNLLLQNLVSDSIACQDSHRHGIAIDEQAHVIAEDGSVHATLYALPPAKEAVDDPEVTSIAQIRSLAEAIVREVFTAPLQMWRALPNADTFSSAMRFITGKESASSAHV